MTPRFHAPWIAILAVATFFLVPARADWPIFRGDAALLGVASTTLNQKPAIMWSARLPDSSLSSPIVKKGMIFIGADDGSVVALDAATGASRWRVTTTDAVEAPPLFFEDRILVGNNSGEFLAIQPETGKTVWKLQLGDRIVGSANGFHRQDHTPTVVVGCYDQKLYAMDARDGRRLWTFETDNYINGAPSVAGGHIFFGGCDALLHRIDGSTGKQLVAVEAGSYIAASAAISPTRAYFGHYEAQFLSVDLRKGEVAWRFGDPQKGLPFFSCPAVSEDRVLAGSRDGNLYCLDAVTGREIWRFATRGEVDSSPVIAGDMVLCGSTDGRLTLLSLKTGARIWSHDLGSPITCSPAVANHALFVVTTDGTLFCFGAKP